MSVMCETMLCVPNLGLQILTKTNKPINNNERQVKKIAAPYDDRGRRPGMPSQRAEMKQYGLNDAQQTRARALRQKIQESGNNGAQVSVHCTPLQY